MQSKCEFLGSTKKNDKLWTRECSMKTLLGIIIYGIEFVITFLIIHIGITFIATHLLNQSVLHYKVQEGLITNQIAMIFLLIIVRFAFIPIKINIQFQNILKRFF